MIFDLQELRERQGREAAMAATEARRRADLARCLDEWRPYVLRRCPLRPTESREVIQDQVYAQVSLEITGAMS